MIAEGYAEAIKHAFIRSPELLEILESQAQALLHVDPLTTIDVVRRNVAIKASVVAQDEHDDDLRAILNYGHTIGHALEAVTGYSAILHGAADAIGMMAAAEIGRRSGITPQAVIERQRTVLERFGLPTRPPAGIAEADIMEAISLDKKVVGGVVRWVLLEDIGRPVVRGDIPLDTVRSVVHDLISS
jgi:3-dehydroquinate synthase